MKYVFDNNALTAIFKHYYPSNFPSFWTKFNGLVTSKDVISVREVKQELKNMELWKEIKKWASNYQDFFENPTVREMGFIANIYRVKHFQQNISQKKLFSGGPMADPFIIAKAGINNASVVTLEKFKPNAATIPNICKHFGINCIDLKAFLSRENWQF